jgi:hypothetical protein
MVKRKPLFSSTYDEVIYDEETGSRYGIIYRKKPREKRSFLKKLLSGIRSIWDKVRGRPTAAATAGKPETPLPAETGAAGPPTPD